MALQKPLLAALLGFAATPVAAKTYVVTPAPCPAPADVIIYRIPANVEAEDQNGWSLAADGAVVIYDVSVHGWASRRLFARFVLDPKGLERMETPLPAALRDCGTRKPRR